MKTRPKKLGAGLGCAWAAGWLAVAQQQRLCAKPIRAGAGRRSDSAGLRAGDRGDQRRGATATTPGPRLLPPAGAVRRLEGAGDVVTIRIPVVKGAALSRVHGDAAEPCQPPFV